MNTLSRKKIFYFDKNYIDNLMKIDFYIAAIFFKIMKIKNDQPVFK